MTSQARYQEALSSIPKPGCGCHTFLLKVANLGIFADLSPAKIFEDIRQSIPSGSRKIPDREIMDAINKALGDHNGSTYTSQPRPQTIVQNGKAALQKIIDQGTVSDEGDLCDLSPIHLRSRLTNPILLLESLYEPTDLIWIGERYEGGKIGHTIRTTSEWICYFRSGGERPPHIISNPLNGILSPKKSGEGRILRGDGNVASYRFCMVEFDNLSNEDQIRFWSAIKLPIVALIDSGGKSIHAWLDVQKIATVETAAQWDTEIKNHLYYQLLKPLGVDGSCSNPARLSRLPGHLRDKSSEQRILWLSREGRKVC